MGRGITVRLYVTRVAALQLAATFDFKSWSCGGREEVAIRATSIAAITTVTHVHALGGAETTFSGDGVTRKEPMVAQGLLLDSNRAPRTARLGCVPFNVTDFHFVNTLSLLGTKELNGDAKDEEDVRLDHMTKQQHRAFFKKKSNSN